MPGILITGSNRGLGLEWARSMQRRAGGYLPPALIPARQHPSVNWPKRMPVSAFAVGSNYYRNCRVVPEYGHECAPSYTGRFH